MKYSFMTFSTPELTLEQVLEAAGRFGYDGIEVRVDANHKHGVEVAADRKARAEARRKAEAAGIPIACVATSVQVANSETAKDMIAQALERIDLAAEVGAHRIRVFGGAFPESQDRERATQSAVESCKAIADCAARRKVIVCIETHDAWCDPGHVAEVLRRVDHPFIACNWDIMHPIRAAGATMDSAFGALKPWIRHLHVHDGTLTDQKLVPIGEGAIDHRRAVELLLEAGYDGYLSGEWIGWEPWEVHLPRELATLKRYEDELGG